MKQDFNVSVRESQAVEIEHLIGALMQKLATLAPHPNRPSYVGALGIAGAEPYMPAAEYDGMAGAMMLETMIGSAFVSDLADVADATSTVMTDRHQSVSSQFNTRAHLQSAYKVDMYKRQNLEAWIATCLRDLYASKNYVMRYDFALAA